MSFHLLCSKDGVARIPFLSTFFRSSRSRNDRVLPPYALAYIEKQLAGCCGNRTPSQLNGKQVSQPLKSGFSGLRLVATSLDDSLNIRMASVFHANIDLRNCS